MRPDKELPPQFATFHVPLRFNKLDIRDYLLNVYNVSTTRVRSHLVQSPVRTDEVTNRIKRAPPTKYMTVEMAKPFVWPAEPTDEEREKWHGEEMRLRIAAEKAFADRRDRFQKSGEIAPKVRVKFTPDRRMLQQQAKDLLSGKTKWDNKRTLDPKWTKGKTL